MPVANEVNLILVSTSLLQMNRGQVPLDRAKQCKFFTALFWMSRDFAD